MAKNTISVRANPNFKKELDDIKIKRMKMKGKDTRTSRITLAMTRHRLFKNIKEDIINADLK